MTFKKSIAFVSAAAIAFSAIAPAATFAASPFIGYADQLVAANVIGAQANEAGFRLADKITRAEVAKVAALAAKLDVSATSTSFSDVSSAFAGYVSALVAKGAINNGTTFRSNANITRFEALKILVKAFGTSVSAASTNSFADVAAGSEVNNVVEAALSKGLISRNVSFRPNDSITRGEFFKIAAGSSSMAASTNNGSDDLGDLLSGLFGSGTTGTTTTTNPTSTVMGDGVLEVTLNNGTPSASTIPANVSGITVAKFDLAAGSADVTVSGIKLKRVGFSNEDTLSSLALSTSAGRISKGKNENSSDDTVDFTLNSPVVVKAGSVLAIHVLASVANQATASGDEFAVEILSVSSNAKSVKLTGVRSMTMKVGGVDASGITLDDDGSLSDVKVGEMGKEVAKFKIENTDNEQPVTVSSITLKEVGTADDETDVANFKLYMDGNLVASTANSTDKYVTFNLASEVKASKTNKFVVKADIIGGAAKTLNFTIDSILDVTATSARYGYGAGVTNNFAGAALNIQAGELVLAQVDAPSTTIRENKKDVILGKIKVTTAAGKSLEVRKVKVAIATATRTTAFANGGETSDFLENIELYDETNGRLYDLTAPAAATTETYYDTDLTIALPASGTITFAIRADTKNVSATLLTDFAKARFSVSVSPISNNSTTSGFYVVETEDDNAVSDITPSAMTFKNVDGSQATPTLSVITMSSAKNAVIGSKDVEALTFEVKADDSSAIEVSEVRVSGTPSTATFDSTNVSEVKLYKGSVSEANLLDRVSGSQIASEIVTFDGFNLNIAKNQSQKFVVTFSVVDDATNAADALLLGVKGIEIEDEDNDNVYVEGTDSNVTVATYTSARTVTITGAGTLALTVDNTDTETSKNKTVLANATTPFVASWEFVANNEGVKVKDLAIAAIEAGNAVAFESAVAEIVLYKNDKVTEIARKSVTSDVTTFNDINYVVAEGSSNVYAKLVTQKIGKDAAGQSDVNGYELKMYVTDADGDASGKAVNVNAYNSLSTEQVDVINGLVDVNEDAAADASDDASDLNIGSEQFDIINGQLDINEDGAITAADDASDLVVGAEQFDVINGQIDIGENGTAAEAGDDASDLVIADTIGASNTAIISPVRVSSVAFVSSFGGTSVASKLTNGQNTVAILAVTADSSSNTDGTDGSALETVLRQLNFTITSDADVAANSTVVTRIDGPGSDDDFATTHLILTAAGAGDNEQTVTTTLASATDTNKNIVNGTAYFAVKVTVSGLTDSTQQYVEAKLSNLDNGSTITYSSDDAGLSDTADTAYLPGANDAGELTAATVGALNLSFDTLTATKVSQ